MCDANDITARTWLRSVDIVKKVGYSDGVIDGQNATFQTSFNMGYSQGLEFGFRLGEQQSKQKSERNSHKQLIDTRRINCQICLNALTLAEGKSVGDLYNIQKEKNDDHLNK